MGFLLDHGGGEEGRLLSRLSLILDRQSLHDAGSELALLAAWAWLAEQDLEHEFPHPRDPATITDAYRALATHLGAAGQVFERSRIGLDCTGATLKEIQAAIATHPPQDRQRLMVQLVERLPKYIAKNRLPLSTDLADLLVGLAQVQDAEVLLADSATAMTLASMPLTGEAHLKLSSLDPIPAALGMIAGAQLVLDKTPGQMASTKHNVGVVLALLPLGKSGQVVAAQGSSLEADTLCSLVEMAQRRIVLVRPGSGILRGESVEAFGQIVRRGWLDTVILLPGGLLPGTSLTANVLVIDKMRQVDTPVVFVDADRMERDRSRQRGRSGGLRVGDDILKVFKQREVGDYSNAVSGRDIESKKFDLSARTYIEGQASRELDSLPGTVPLMRLATLIRAQLMRDSASGGEVFLEAGVADIAENGLLQQPRKQVKVAGKGRAQAGFQRLRPGDILMTIKGGRGSAGRVGLVDESCEDNWVAGQVFLIIRINDDADDLPISSEYLYRYLDSKIAQDYLKEVTAPTSIFFLRAKDIRDLPVPVPTADALERLQKVHQSILAEHDQIQGHVDRIQVLKQDWLVQLSAVPASSNNSSGEVRGYAD